MQQRFPLRLTAHSHGWYQSTTSKMHVYPQNFKTIFQQVSRKSQVLTHYFIAVILKMQFP